MEKNIESPVGEVTSINVSNLSYVPNRKIVKQYLEYARYQLSVMNLGWLIPFYKGEHRKMLLMGAPLRNITFSAFAGDMTVILGAEMERREIVQLLTGRKKEGTFDGHISMRGAEIPAGSYYLDHVAYVQKVPFSSSFSVFHPAGLMSHFSLPLCRNPSSFPA
jgi:hypothetical protein